MKLHTMSLLRRVLKEEQGQAIVFIALGMLAFVGISGVSIDLVNAYTARQALQASTNSAALSGAVYISGADTTDAVSAVYKYSSMTGDLNATPTLTNVQVQTPTFSCLSTVKSWGTACVGVSGTYPNGFNSMKVTQTADVQTWFAKLFGIPTFHLSATAYASPGSAPQPLNLAIILDSTLSMDVTVTGAAATADPQCKNQTEMFCALNGIAILLNSLPSPTDAPAALFTFPNVQANTAYKDISPCGTPTEMSNSTPSLSSSYGPTGSSATYEVVPFTTDYANLTKAVGVVNPTTQDTITNGCMSTSSGAPAGTYLAGAIVAAQSALVAEQAVHPVATGQNVMVILTDGNVNGSDQYAHVDSALKMFASSFSTSSTSAPSDAPITPSTTVSYPSGVGGCGQAVQEADAAKSSALQTSIFVVAYGSPTTGVWNPNKDNLKTLYAGSNGPNNFVDLINAANCPSDQNQFFSDFYKNNYGSLPTSNNVSAYPNISPCSTAQDLATPNKAATDTTSAIIYFYSDTQGASSNACASAAPVGDLASIFQSIAGSLPRPPRLIPAGTQ